MWWRCHRRIITDYLIYNGAKVFHIIDDHEPKAAELNPGAKKNRGHLIYPEEKTAND